MILFLYVKPVVLNDSLMTIFVHSKKSKQTLGMVGLGLVYKDSLPINIRNGLSFDESIVIELNFGRKNVFLYSAILKSCLLSYLS